MPSSGGCGCGVSKSLAGVSRMASDADNVKSIDGLVSGFRANLAALRDPQTSEAVVRQEYIDPFWKALGWDVANKEPPLARRERRADRSAGGHDRGRKGPQPSAGLPVPHRRLPAVRGRGQEAGGRPENRQGVDFPGEDLRLERPDSLCHPHRLRGVPAIRHHDQALPRRAGPRPGRGIRLAIRGLRHAMGRAAADVQP